MLLGPLCSRLPTASELGFGFLRVFLCSFLRGGGAPVCQIHGWLQVENCISPRILTTFDQEGPLREFMRRLLVSGIITWRRGCRRRKLGPKTGVESRQHGSGWRLWGVEAASLCPGRAGSGPRRGAALHPHLCTEPRDSGNSAPLPSSGPHSCVQKEKASFAGNGRASGQTPLPRQPGPCLYLGL